MCDLIDVYAICSTLEGSCLLWAHIDANSIHLIPGLNYRASELENYHHYTPSMSLRYNARVQLPENVLGFHSRETSSELHGYILKHIMAVPLAPLWQDSVVETW